MTPITIIMYITITVLSIITFGIKGSLVLLIISPLLIVYLNSNSINIKKKNIEKRNFRERKEVEFVSSRDRKKAISDGTKKKVYFNVKQWRKLCISMIFIYYIIFL